MGLNCGCPLGAHIADLNIEECKESMGQIQKVAFQRIYKTAGTLNAVDDPTKKASWTTLFSAADSTKITVSPYIQGPTTEPGAARTFGSGNQVLGGIPIVIGREATGFTGTIYQENQKVIAQMKQYACETIGVWLVDENGNISVGDVIQLETSNTYIYSTSRTVTALGVDNLIIVETPDAVMVCCKDKVQDVKKIIKAISDKESLL